MKQLVTYPDPVLSKKAGRVVKFNSQLRELIKNMIETMDLEGGIGLAAPQIGVSKQVIVIKDSRETRALINPVLTWFSKELSPSKEGCLSCPDLWKTVMRHNSVTVQFQRIDGGKATCKFTDLESCCVQHEIDHLQGKTLYDYEDLTDIFEVKQEKPKSRFLY